MPRTLEYYVATTLDGFIAREDGTYDCFPNDETFLPSFQGRIQTHYGAVVMGRATYEVGLAEGVTNPYPWLSTYVVSRTLEAPADAPVTIIGGDAVEAVRALKAEEGRPVWLCGGGALAGTLLRAGLIDSLVLKVNPVVLGRGIPLFREGPAADWSLGRSESFPGGTIVLHYAAK